MLNDNNNSHFQLGVIPNTMLASINNSSGAFVCQPNAGADYLICRDPPSYQHQHHQQQQIPHLSGGNVSQGSRQQDFARSSDPAAILDNQMMYNNESNYTTLMQHLYANDNQNLPNIECGGDMFAGGVAGVVSDGKFEINSGANDCRFQGQEVQHSTNYPLSKMLQVLNIFRLLNSSSNSNNHLPIRV